MNKFKLVFDKKHLECNAEQLLRSFNNSDNDSISRYGKIDPNDYLLEISITHKTRGKKYFCQQDLRLELNDE